MKVSQELSDFLKNNTVVEMSRDGKSGIIRLKSMKRDPHKGTREDLQGYRRNLISTDEYKQTLAYQSGEIRRTIKQILTEMGVIGILDKTARFLTKLFRS